MLKYLVILAVAVFMAIRVYGQPNEATHKEEQGTKQSPRTIVSANSPYKQNCCCADQAKFSSDAPKWYAPFERSEWWLVIIAAFTGCVICWQSWETRKSAKAALLNVQAVIHAERARLLFVVEKELDTEMRGVGIFTIYAVNYGRSPAELIGFREPIETIVNSPNELPVPIGDTTLTITEQRYLIPKDRIFVAQFIPNASKNTVPAMELAQATGISVNAQSRMIYGEVSYRDGISSEARVSRYCFRFEREPFRNIGGSILPAGPAEYNKCT